MCADSAKKKRFACSRTGAEQKYHHIRPGSKRTPYVKPRSKNATAEKSFQKSWRCLCELKKTEVAAQDNQSHIEVGAKREQSDRFAPLPWPLQVRRVPHIMPYIAHKRLVTVVHTPIHSYYYPITPLPIRIHSKVRPSVLAAELQRIRDLPRAMHQSYTTNYLNSRGNVVSQRKISSSSTTSIPLSNINNFFY